MVSNAIANGDSQAINYFVAQKYVEALESFARSPNEKLVFMPMESSSVIGALGGINELFKDLNGKGRKGKSGSGIPNS